VGAGPSLVEAESTLLELCPTPELLLQLGPAVAPLRSLPPGDNRLQTFWQNYRVGNIQNQ
jgi:hypothetical protein